MTSPKFKTVNNINNIFKCHVACINSIARIGIFQRKKSVVIGYGKNCRVDGIDTDITNRPVAVIEADAGDYLVLS